ncbi:MAG TPA: SapC family protein [Rhizobacter sp.]|jgi:hypothetical protein|nr:SapC family protein [Rhizobacter sp.]
MNPAPLPLFYRQPRVLQPGLHGGRSLAQVGRYGFAAGANAVPLLAAEVAQASRLLPVVFAAGELPSLLLVLGLADGQNLCVDDSGQWQLGSYVPSYLRRYPFIFLEDEARQELTLCIDEAATVDVLGGEHALFESDGQPSALTRSALAFCRDYQAHHLLTLEFCRAVAEAGLLVEKRAEIALRDGQKLSLSGFKVIDEDRLNRLPAEQLLAWRAKGWLPLIYAHLQSADNWRTLIERAPGRNPA